jgi:hypothetical protein
MYYLTEGDMALDAKDIDSINHHVYDFCPAKEDYFLNFFVSWNKIESDMYKFIIGSWRFEIPSGVYVFAGCEAGVGDWILSDELVGRDLDFFTLSPSCNKWSFEEHLIESSYKGVYYYPNTKNPMPLVDESGSRMILIAQTDQYSKMKGKDFYDLFTI